MTLTDIILLASIQGVTEFLPISSSGHLLAARLLFGLSDEHGATIDAFLHLGTLGAVILYYWRVWWGIARSLIDRGESSREQHDLLLNIVVATIPAATVGYLFGEQINTALRGPGILAASLVATALLLWLTDRGPFVASLKPGDRISRSDAIAIGLAQVLALVPGISRSGSTIAAGRWRGLSRRQASTFSFIISAPIIAGASLSALPALLSHHTIPPTYLLVGVLIAGVTGLLSIKLLLKFIEQISLVPFAIYLLALAGVVVWYA